MAATATRTPGTGSAYVALTNLSLPRPGREKDDPNDLVEPGETVILTDEQAAPYLRCGGRTGRRVPVIRKLDDVKADGGIPRLLPRQLSGPLFAPPPPSKDSDDPRPDPAGSSHLIVNEVVPEASEPFPGDEQVPSAPAWTEDIPPSGSAARRGRAAATGAG
jgi:hypothetical protein